MKKALCEFCELNFVHVRANGGGKVKGEREREREEDSPGSFSIIASLQNSGSVRVRMNYSGYSIRK